MCISASHIVKNQKESTSYYISKMVAGELSEKGISCGIVELREYELTPCAGCEQCAGYKKCIQDADFNRIYEQMTDADYLFFISPYCAPIPARLSVVLEKMEQIASGCRQKAHSHKWEMYGRLAGIIAYGEGGSKALENYKTMVNDTIASALCMMQVKTVPYNLKWDTGIVLPLDNACQIRGEEWKQEELEEEVRKYVKVIVQTAKSVRKRIISM